MIDPKSPSNLLTFPHGGAASAAVDGTRRRGNAVELICGCCQLPFSEIVAGPGGHLVEAAPAAGMNIYSRHYGKTHTNQVKFNGVGLVVTERREFVIVPLAEVGARRVA